ncbi:MAG: 3'-5' exonuclease [Spirochaetaceae bacterium]|jgi:DNA polymerase III epsilon subunit-like protein|nr:3'-5' exonuclease [Spirochaetaceae bacterium]
MAGLRQFWVDTETTGLSARRNFAFQIAYLIEEDGEIAAARTLEMRPDCLEEFEISEGARRVHGRSRDEILAMPPESAQYRLLLDDLEKYQSRSGEKLTVTGYNAAFDIGFIKALFSRVHPEGLKAYYAYFSGLPCDVLQFAQGLRAAGLLEAPKLTLDALCGVLGIAREGPHDAAVDVAHTRAAFYKLLELAGRGRGVFR